MRAGGKPRRAGGVAEATRCLTHFVGLRHRSLAPALPRLSPAWSLPWVQPGTVPQRHCQHCSSAHQSPRALHCTMSPALLEHGRARVGSGTQVRAHAWGHRASDGSTVVSSAEVCCSHANR